MHLPTAFLDSLALTKGFDRNAFEKVHADGKQITSIRLNPRKKFEFRNSNFEFLDIPWTQYGFYLKERPSFTFDPLFHAGCYYVQEASSMFLEQALKQTVDLSKPIKVLDLCAAPGGKSTHIQSLITKESLLVSNEVIKNRNNILKDNIIKWGCENVVVTNNDPRDFSRLQNYFDVVVVDAPCSGSGLFRKEPDAIEQWSENNVILCNQRQKRILADVWPALKKDGILIYATCSYSKEEDEDIIKWIEEQLIINNEELKVEPDWGITKTDSSYRFWPDKVRGEGFFISVIRKKEEEEQGSFRISKKLNELSPKELEFLKPWYSVNNQKTFVHGFDGIYAVDKKMLEDINHLHSALRVSYFGTYLGEIMKERLVPAHSLAMSNLLIEIVPKISLNLDQAIRYLQKKDIDVKKNHKGWQLVCFNNHQLGWVNVLPNRINNYYPKELRILKDS